MTKTAKETLYGLSEAIECNEDLVRDTVELIEGYDEFENGLKSESVLFNAYDAAIVVEKVMSLEKEIEELKKKASLWSKFKGQLDIEEDEGDYFLWEDMTRFELSEGE